MTQPPYGGQGAAPGAAFGEATITRSHGDAGSPTASVPAVTDVAPGPSGHHPQPGFTPQGGRHPSVPAQLGPLPPGPQGAMPPGPQGSVLPGPQGSAPPGARQSAPRPSRPRGPRRARLQLRHVNPWTVLRFSCVLAIALFFVWLIVVGVLYGVLDATGAIGKINDSVTTINGPGSKAPITPGIVFGSAAIIGAVNIVLFIALSTVGSVVYNLCADLVGGVELTLSER